MFMEIYKIYFKKPRGLKGFTLCCEDFIGVFKQNIFCRIFVYKFFYELN